MRIETLLEVTDWRFDDRWWKRWRTHLLLMRINIDASLQRSFYANEIDEGPRTNHER